MANEVYCPHCKKEMRDVWELFGAGDDEATVDCEKCGKEFTVVQTMTVEWSVKHDTAEGHPKS